MVRKRRTSSDETASTAARMLQNAAIPVALVARQAFRPPL